MTTQANTAEPAAPYNWQALELAEAVETVSGNSSARARLTPYGRIELTGTFKIAAGKEVKPGELLAHLPEALRVGAKSAIVPCCHTEHGTRNVQIETNNGQITLEGGTAMTAGMQLQIETSFSIN